MRHHLSNNWNLAVNFFLDNWELALLLATWGVFGVISFKRRSDWRQRRFTQQVNFSLNIIEDTGKGKFLEIRTLLEDGALNVWLNQHGVSVVRKAATQTTKINPFIQIQDQKEREAIMIGLLNVLSERFSDVFVAKSLGLPVLTDTFLFGLTWERYSEMKTEKLRTIVIRKTDLELLNSDPNGISTYQESHRPRVETLKSMHRLRSSTNPEERDTIREVELGVCLPFTDQKFQIETS